MYIRLGGEDLYWRSKIYGIEDPIELKSQSPPSKDGFKYYIVTKYHEKKLRAAASSNSKMMHLNVNLKGLNGKVHPAMAGIISTQCVVKGRVW